MRIKPWNLKWDIDNVIRKLTGKKSLEKEREERMKSLRELMVPGSVRVMRPSMTTGYLEKLAEDFSLSSLTLEKANGGKVVSSLGDSSPKASASLFQSVAQALPDARYMVVRGQGKTHVFYPNNGHIFVIETEGTLTGAELSALARKVEKGVNNT